MATRDKHRKRSHVSYAEEVANYRHWLMTRPYIPPVGFERMMMYLTGMQNIRDVIPFPRTPKNCEF